MHCASLLVLLPTHISSNEYYINETQRTVPTTLYRWCRYSRICGRPMPMGNTDENEKMDWCVLVWTFLATRSTTLHDKAIFFLKFSTHFYSFGWAQKKNGEFSTIDRAMMWTQVKRSQLNCIYDKFSFIVLAAILLFLFHFSFDGFSSISGIPHSNHHGSSQKHSMNPIILIFSYHSLFYVLFAYSNIFFTFFSYFKTLILLKTFI